MGIVVVTGANRGIGLELCRQLKAQGEQVVGVCRRASEALEALGIRFIEGIDIAKADSVADLAQALKGERIDLLINNAGILRGDSLDQLSFDDITLQMEVNAYGPLRVTHALLAGLGDGAKVAIITSRMGSIADNTSGGRYGYRMSKAAVNMAGKSLALDLKGQGVSVALLHPGFVRTEMTRGNGLVDARESAAGLLARIEGLNLQNTGSFWHMNGEELPW